MEEKRNDLPKYYVIATCISAAAGFAALILAILVLLGIGDWAINVAVPLLGVVEVCQVYLQWNKNRKTAYVCLATAVFIFICAIVVFFLP